MVLSNNDGCVVALCKYAKALGIPRGKPLFQIESLIVRHKVEVFSSNYELYGDLSRRVMSILEGMAPHVEVYSIDEAFLDLTRLTEPPLTLGRRILELIPRWTGIPVSVGIGPTKVLAKAANHRAKKDPSAQGLLHLETPEQIRRVLAEFPVEDLWGIGRAHTAFLARKGITWALQLANCDDTWVKKHLHLPVLNLVWELRGKQSMDLDTAPSPKEGIMCSRSFNHLVGDLPSLQESVVDYASRAVEKLRRQESLARVVTVHVGTNPFKEQDAQYHASAVEILDLPTDHTPTLAAAALRALERLYRTGFRYKKTAVFLSDISDGNRPQGHLFLERSPQEDQVMEAVDGIKAKYGRHSLGLLGAGVKRTWAMSRSLLSPAYTTRWRDLAVAR